VATACGDHTARIWPVTPEDLIEQGLRRLPFNPTSEMWNHHFANLPYERLREDLP
jgi:hypothetical protein